MSNLPARFPYQEYMYQRIIKRGRTAVIGVPGCGKTRPVIDALVARGVVMPGGSFPKGSIIVICPGSAIPTWKRQFQLWVDDSALANNIHIVRGTKHERVYMWKRAHTESGIYITNAACFRLDFGHVRKVPWAAAIADEYHKYMRRRKSQTYKRFRAMTRHMEVMILISGSLVSKGPASMFTAFQLINPFLHLFRSYWRFLKTFCLIVDGDYGWEIVGMKNVERLKKLMDRYLAYVPKEVVSDQLPEGRRMAIDVEMTAEQAHIYRELKDDMLAILDDGGVIVAPTVMGKVLKLRQLLCCPRILNESLGMGAGYEMILERLEDQPHIVIFVPFRAACTYVAEALTSKGYAVDILRGGTSPEMLDEITNRFRRTGSIIVCTIAYAESFDLETCETSFFLGYDYNVDPNEQAEGRTRRAISEYPFVTWNYLKYVETLDELLLMNLEINMNSVSRILKRPAAFICALKGE